MSFASLPTHMHIQGRPRGLWPAAHKLWPEYHIGKVYTYGITSALDSEDPEKREFGAVLSGVAPEKGSLENRWMSRAGRVCAQDRFRSERRVLKIAPQNCPASSMSLAYGFIPTYPDITLSDGRIIRPHIVAIDFDDDHDPSAPDSNKLFATAQFFNRLRDAPFNSNTSAFFMLSDAPSPPPKPFLMIRERILVHPTVSDHFLKFEVIGDEPMGPDLPSHGSFQCATSTAGTSRPVYSLMALSSSGQEPNAEFLRDAKSHVLYVWSGHFSDSNERITMLEQFVPDAWHFPPPGSDPTVAPWPATYWS